MKRWIALLIVFGLIGCMILMSSCTWEEFDEFMGGHYGCGCFWDCTKSCIISLSGNGEDYVNANPNDPCGSCIEIVGNCTCSMLDSFLCSDE